VRLKKRLSREELEELAAKTKFSQKEVRALYSRFRRLAPYGYLNAEQFRNTMGVLGLTDNTFLPDRMFKIFDVDGDDALNFEEFATSLAVMIRGTEDEKLRLSFDMTAGVRGAKGITQQDFHQLIEACNAMLNSLVAPTGGAATEEDVDRLFHDLSSDEGGHHAHSSSDSGEETGKEVITWEAYRAAAQGDETFLQCLGLKPNNVTSRRQSAAAFGGGRSNLGKRDILRGHSGGGLPLQQHHSTGGSMASQSYTSQGHGPNTRYIVTQGQLDEIRSRVDRLQALMSSSKERQPNDLIASSGNSNLNSNLNGNGGNRELHSSNSGSGSGGAGANGAAQDPNKAVAKDEVADERWWTPLPKKAAPRISIPSQSGSLNALDEITAELDRVLGWCAVAEGGPTGNDGALTSMAMQLPMGPLATRAESSHAPESGQNTPARREVSRDSEQTDAVNFSRTNVHRSRTTKVVSGDSAYNTGASDNGDHPLARREKSFSATTRRTRKMHRLMGPRKGLAVHFGHENWNMVVSMMIGIRMAVGRSKHEMQRELQPCDFYMKDKFSIVPRMANVFDNTVSRRVTMTRFVDYAPMVFQRIRNSFGIQHDDYLRSVGPEQLLGNMVLGNLSSLSELSSEGKSGAFFYYTADGNYMLKTVSPKEYLLLKKMLKAYHDHIFSSPGTLLVRFLGLHCLSVRKARKGLSCGKTIKKLYFVVMANMFNTPYEIHRRYDLKGSWVGRHTPPDKYDPSVAQKDVDFQDAGECVRIGEERRSQLLKQLEVDSNFLASQGIIDYSLLLGIHEISGQASEADDAVSTEAFRMAASGKDWSTDHSAHYRDAPAGNAARHSLLTPGTPSSAHVTSAPREVPIHRRDSGGMLSLDRRTRYFIGVIDILTPYDTFKIMEHRLKSLRWDPKGVSCCPPGMYADRFNKFMHQAFA